MATDRGHKDALNDAEKVRKVCYDELSTRNGNGVVYTCSDSTYSSRASVTDTACSGYATGCEAWSKDDKVVGCSEIEDQMNGYPHARRSIRRGFDPFFVLITAAF